MKKHPNDYWKKRAIRDSVKMFLTTEETEKLIDQAYDHAERLLTDEIHQLLKRTQKKSGYDVDKLIRILQEEVPTSELLLLNEAVKTTTDKKRRKELRTMLNLLAIQYRISRLDVLHAKAAILAEKIGEQQEKLSTRLFRKIIKDTYQEEQQNLTERKQEPMDPMVVLDEDHHPHPLVQLTDDTTPQPPKGTTVTKPDITTPKEVPKAEMEALLSSKWKGANFSQRIWKDTDELARKLQKLFAVEQMTGMAEKDIAKEIEYLISDAFLLHKNIARRLVRTEANRFHTQAKIQQWQKMGLKHVKYVAVLDNRTTHICMELDGSIFRLDELETGKNCPPMHPWCRSIIQAYFGEVVEPQQAVINQAKQLGKKVAITEQAISKVKLVNIPGYTEEENRRIQDLHKELLTDAMEKNDSNEVGYVVTNSNVSKVFGDVDKVDYTSTHETDMLLKLSAENSLTVLHNHPGGSTFSLEDLYFFIEQKAVKTLTIVTNQGKVMFVTKTKIIDKATLLPRLQLLKYSDDHKRNVDITLKELYNVGVKYKEK